MHFGTARRGECALLVAAVVWGLAFAAQRAGMGHMGPFTFNGLRFCMGGLFLLPLVLVQRRRGTALPVASRSAWVNGVLVAGLVLLVGASLQQHGMRFTTAGKGGFITGLYVILVPLFGLVLGQRCGWGTWLGVLCAAIGLYVLSVRQGLQLSPGDGLVLAGAAVWAIHVLVLDTVSKRMDPLVLACGQFLLCGGCSMGLAFLFEAPTMTGILAGWLPLAYSGIASVGIGFTLQVVGQRSAAAAPAALILSLEAVFAVVGGWVVFGETMDARGWVGCILMFAGMGMAQTHLWTSARRCRWIHEQDNEDAPWRHCT